MKRHFTVDGVICSTSWPHLTAAEVIMRAHGVYDQRIVLCLPRFGRDGRTRFFDQGNDPVYIEGAEAFETCPRGSFSKVATARVGAPARLEDELRIYADKLTTWALSEEEIGTVRPLKQLLEDAAAALATGARSDETAEQAQSEGRQSGPQGNAQGGDA